MKDYKKEYEQAFERAKNYHEGHTLDVNPQAAMEYVFPELKESKDEKMRNHLLNWFKDCKWDAVDNGTLKRDDIIAWLEKQGEQKPEFCHHEVDFSDCSEEYRKAYYDGWNNCNQQHAQLEAEQKPVDNLKWDELTWEDINTIEEIINEVHSDFRNSIGAERFGKEVLERFRWIKGDEYTDICEQKPAWSEKDEVVLQKIIQCIISLSEECEVDLNEKINWLKSLKERIKGE